MPYRLGVPPVYTEWLALGLTVAFMAAALDGCPQSTRGVSGRARFRQGVSSTSSGGPGECLGSGRGVGMGPFPGPCMRLGIFMSHAWCVQYSETRLLTDRNCVRTRMNCVLKYYISLPTEAEHLYCTYRSVFDKTNDIFHEGAPKGFCLFYQDSRAGLAGAIA